jgi:ABC-type branched-subunit amino acid transport system ATPase component
MTATVAIEAGRTSPRLLEVQDLRAGYGPLQVLFGTSLTVHGGEQVAMLGTNGAGKSTLLRTIAGLMRPSAGRVWFQGEEVTGWRPLRLVERGVIYIAGGNATFPSLTVLENLKMSTYPIRRRRTEVEDRIEEAFTLFPRLRERRGQCAGTLSGGEQQMVALGRALVAKPALLMIDELSLGLAPIMLDLIEEMMRTLAARGVTMLIVEQSLNTAAKVAQRAYFLEKGEIRFEGAIDDLLGRGDLARAVFLGATRAKANGHQRPPRPPTGRRPGARLPR